MSGFWGPRPPPPPPPPPQLKKKKKPHDYLLSHIGSQVKRRQSQSYKFQEFAKISNCWILKQTLHATHLMKLLDKMCKYEKDRTSILEDIERTRFYPQMDRGTDRQGETSIPSFQICWSGGIISIWFGCALFCFLYSLYHDLVALCFVVISIIS